MVVLEAGARAPEFALGDADGQQYSLSGALKQGPLMLAFIKTTCPTCDLIMPYLNRLVEAYGGESWALWAISQDDSEASRRYAQRFKAGFPLVLDGAGWPTSRAYDPPVTPTLFLIEPSGHIEEVGIGFSKDDLNSLSGRIAEHLGVTPTVVAERGDGKPDLRPG